VLSRIADRRARRLLVLGDMPETYEIHPHGPIEPLAPGLWRVVGSSKLTLPRSMYIYRLPDETLLLYSVIAMHPDGMRKLEALGSPAVMVVPHPRHTMDAGFYKARYPSLLIYGSDEAQRELPGLPFDAHPAGGLLPLAVRPRTVPGVKLAETVLELPLTSGGTALLFTDLVNRGDDGVLLKLFGKTHEGGVVRLLERAQIADEGQVRTFLAELSRIPSLEVVAGCHGGVVTDHCNAWLAQAAEQL
jgi:hypothetical protein